MTETQSSQMKETEEKPKDRRLQAVISLMTGVVATISLLLFAIKLSAQPELGILCLMVSIVCSLFGFVLGLTARKSSKGKRMANAGVALTAIPLLVIVAMPLISVVFLSISK